MEIKYADEAALCEFVPSEDFQHEYIFLKGSAIFKVQVLQLR